MDWGTILIAAGMIIDALSDDGNDWRIAEGQAGENTSLPLLALSINFL